MKKLPPHLEARLGAYTRGKVQTQLYTCLLGALSGKKVLSMALDREGRDKNFRQFRESTIPNVQREIGIEIKYRIKGIDYYFPDTGGVVVFRHVNQRVLEQDVSEVWRDEAP